mmetsp:Transcript_50310/g.163014  ORF Transcript_50310/g.163014 Transcript_50310/m.163014 type:complete len:208 (+) Transcript_50310:182-805(+)
MATARRVAPPSLLCGLAATLSSATRVAGCLEMTHAVATLRRCGHSAENVRAPRRRCPRRRACVSTSPSGPRGGCRPRCASVCWSGSEAPSPRAANCCSRATRRDRRRATWRSASSGCRRRWTRRAPHAPEVHHLSSPVHDAPESRQLPTTRPSGERRAAGVCRPALVAGDGGEAARAGPGEAAARPQEGEPREQESGVRVGKESDAF